MNNQNFTVTLLVDHSPKVVFDAVRNVRGWWKQDLVGKTEKLDDEFSVRFGDVHYSKQRLTEVIQDTKVLWLVTDSHLSFLHDKSEWTGTRISFEINREGDKTQLRFSHLGLLPEIECYAACSNAWGGYINNSLLSLIHTGIGKPTK